uniref:Uncharacterized protein n=2 Tax=Aegilops tauschii subsp. strangulata TaxID=200361 RepID=A0A453IHQ9_AEGTS
PRRPSPGHQSPQGVRSVGLCPAATHDHRACLPRHLKQQRPTGDASMAMTTTSSRLTTTQYSFLSSTPCSPTTMAALPRRRRAGARYPRIQAIEFDQNTVRPKRLQRPFCGAYHLISCRVLTSGFLVASGCGHNCRRRQRRRRDRHPDFLRESN